MAEGGEESVCAGVREDGEPLPLIVRPKDGKDSFEFLKSWVAENKEWIDRKLLEHGELCYKWADLSWDSRRSCWVNVAGYGIIASRTESILLSTGLFSMSTGKIGHLGCQL